MNRGQCLVVALLLASGLGGCKKDTAGPSGEVPPSRKIAIMYPIKVDALEQLEKGIRDELKADGVTFVVESAQGNPEMFLPTVRSAVRQDASLLVGMGTQITQTALGIRQELTLPPIVFTAVTNPDDVLPEGERSTPRKLQVTGVSDTPVDIDKQTLAIARAIRPDAKRLGVVYTPSEANSRSSVESLKKAAAADGFEVITASTDSGVGPATTALLKDGAQVIVIPKDKNATGGVATIVETALRAARESTAGSLPVPVIAMDSGSVQDPANGAIAAASAPYYDIGVQTGKVVRRILAGEPAASIAVTGPAQSKVYVNLAAASSFCIEGLRAKLPGAEFIGAEDPARCVVKK